MRVFAGQRNGVFDLDFDFRVQRLLVNDELQNLDMGVVQFGQEQHQQYQLHKWGSQKARPGKCTKR